MKKLITLLLVFTATIFTTRAGTGHPVKKNKVTVPYVLTATDQPLVKDWAKLPHKKPSGSTQGTEKRYQTEWVCEPTAPGESGPACSCMTLYSTVVFGQTIYYALCSQSSACGPLPTTGGVRHYDVGCPYEGI